MAIANTTPYAVQAVPYLAPDGSETVLVVVKATFRKTGGRILLSDDQVPVRIAEVPGYPDAPESSVRYPSDVGGEKRGTDVVVVGSAVSSRPVKAAGVAVRVRERTVGLRVHGERLYYRGLTGVAVSAAAPFERKPIEYERAYGGTTADFAIVERRNPVGRGVARRASDLVDRPAPQIEDPAEPITGAGGSPEPVGFGAIASHWLPRSDFFGTLDDAWKATRMPLFPLDFDERYFNVAHPRLQFQRHLDGSDAIAVLGMHTEGLWRVELPTMRVTIRGIRDDGARLSAQPPIDVVLVEPEAERIEMVARHLLPKGRGRTLLREVGVDGGS